MSDEIDYYQKGCSDYNAWTTAHVYLQFSRDLAPEDVMRFFMPPPAQDMMQVQRPFPKNHVDWLRGFNDAQRGALKIN